MADSQYLELKTIIQEVKEEDYFVYVSSPFHFLHGADNFFLLK